LRYFRTIPVPLPPAHSALIIDIIGVRSIVDTTFVFDLPASLDILYNIPVF
jgi:hypothetical protein